MTVTERIAKARPILDMIYRHEAPVSAQRSQGVPTPYDVVYSGIPAAHRPKALLTSYPIGEVIEWQRFVVSKGAKSSACGAPQFIRTTLQGLGLPLDRVFDAACQDEAALKLLDRRGWDDCEAGSLTPIDFADHLSREWASLPVQRAQRGASRAVTVGQSYYAGDGLNRAFATPAEVLAAVTAALGNTPAPAPADALTARVAALEAANAALRTANADLLERVAAIEAWAADFSTAVAKRTA